MSKRSYVHPAIFRAKARAVSGSHFNHLKRAIKIEKASKASIAKLKALGIEIEKDLTEIRAKYLIRRHASGER